MTASVALLPKLFAKSPAPAVPVAEPTPVPVRPETRAVARRADAT